ncbi:SGNH/GDSL hydrolase family protein [Sagittula salina]|uniref:SGNH/GDSL hydrolase family protein n=1 Tax=Sagittula salina TaxID=2820268 RepID=A0A940S3K2_9RHOB|nr:SGNH/GDSL hydrolase family protein [Sagittula salina]MBP0482870.1 SGNH/GDSL hydrolase family protein [Sagittula salina]
MTVILCYGDSNTHGTAPMAAPGGQDRHPKGRRWPDVLAAELGEGVEVIPEGLPGRTTVHEDVVEGGCRDGAAVLQAVLNSHRPIDLMILMLGTNDLKSRFSVTAWEIARSVERLVLMAKAEGVVRRILVVAPVPVREIGSLAEVFVGAEARQAGLTELLRAVAERQGCGFFDAGACAVVSPVDGVHMEEAGHIAIGHAMAAAVRDALA